MRHTLRRENVFAGARQPMKVAQYLQRLPRQWHEMEVAILHVGRRDPPDALLKIHVRSFRGAQFQWPHEDERPELQGCGGNARMLQGMHRAHDAPCR